jgi:hypothetical protein
MFKDSLYINSEIANFKLGLREISPQVVSSDKAFMIFIDEKVFGHLATMENVVKTFKVASSFILFT